MALVLALLIAALWTPSVQSPAARPGLDVFQFVMTTPPTASVHASTIVETPAGLVAAWFGGSREGAPDVGIWLSQLLDDGWTVPREIATGVQADGRRFPCWNPVLFRTLDGALHLFYKVGPAPARWWGMERISVDNARTWGEARRLPDGILGPIKNKPLQLADGTLISPSSTESVDADPTWRIHFERSTDAGRTWTPLALLDVPNPNAGIDAVTLADGRQLLVYNHTATGRTPLNVAISVDGRTWKPLLTLEDSPGEYSYPAVIQCRSGAVHVTYTWQRRNIRHVVLNPFAWR